jgi:hypothetical protein
MIFKCTMRDGKTYVTTHPRQTPPSKSHPTIAILDHNGRNWGASSSLSESLDAYSEASGKIILGRRKVVQNLLWVRPTHLLVM